MDALTSNSASKKPPWPARLRAQRAKALLSTGPRTLERLRRPKSRGWLRKEFGADGPWDMVKLREAIEACLGSSAEAKKMAERSKGSLVQANPSLYPSAEIGVNPVFRPPGPGIFKKRSRSRKQKPGKELEPE